MNPFTRTCHIVNTSTGVHSEGAFKLYPPATDDNGENYYCLCEISGFTNATQLKIFGYDPIQALELGLQQLQVEFEILLKDFEIQYSDGTKMEAFILNNSHLWPNT